MSPTVTRKAEDDVPQHNVASSSLQGGAEEIPDDSSESSDEDYFSVADSEDEQVETDADWEAREKERQRVLEAAGLIVNEDVKPPPRLERTRSARKRRTPPAAPHRSSIISDSSSKDLPPVPDPEPSPVDHSTRLDDAFDRYETFKQQAQQTPNSNRLSVASSFETAQSSLGSPAVSLAPSTSGLSKDGEGRSYSHLLNFLGRKTPGSDGPEKRTLTISAPIMNNPDSPSRENSPAFGSVSLLISSFLSTDLVVKSWASLVDKSVVQELPKEERRRQEVS